MPICEMLEVATIFIETVLMKSFVFSNTFNGSYCFTCRNSVHPVRDITAIHAKKFLSNLF